MKLTYVCNEYPPTPHGGIGTFVQALARGLVTRGHQVTVVGWGSGAGEHPDAGVRVVTLPASRRPGVGWLVNRRRLHRWLQGEVAAERTEIIETPEYDGPMPFEFPGCPVVVRLHLAGTTIARQTGRRRSLHQWWSESRTLRRHPNWIAVSQHALRLTLDTFKITPGRPAEVIYYPVVDAAPAGREPLPLPESFVLYAGTLSGRKGAFVLAEAAREFLRAHPELQLVYAGRIAVEAGEPADARVRTVLGPELAGRVRFLGRLERAQILECMRRARLFAFPSSLETFGLVTAEAMLQGCPVVGCDAGPFPEFIEHNHSGLLVRPGDPSGLAAAIMDLLANPARAAALARAGQASIRDRFSLGVAVERNLAYYEACLTAQATVVAGVRSARRGYEAASSPALEELQP